MSSTPETPHTPWSRLLPAGAAFAAVVSLLVLAFLWPSATSSVKDLPIVVAGPSAQAEQLASALAEQSPGTFEVTSVPTREAAVDLIESRSAYGAIVLGAAPEVLTASAASPVVSQQLIGLVPVLKAQATAAAAAQGGGSAPAVAVSVTDVVPLADSDPRGSVLASSSFPLVIGGMLGGILVSTMIVGVWRRVGTLIVGSFAGGLAIAAILQGWIGALQGDYLLNAAAISLTLMAISGVIVGFVAVVGPSGTSIGPVLFLIVANPIASAGTPVEFLASPWGAVGQWLPPGAAATLIRELSYFPAANTTFPWMVLGGWTLLGLLLALFGHSRKSAKAAKAARAGSAEAGPGDADGRTVEAPLTDREPAVVGA